MIGAEVGDIEVAETVIDVAVEGAVFAVVYTVHQARDVLRCEGNDESLEDTIQITLSQRDLPRF